MASNAQIIFAVWKLTNEGTETFVTYEQILDYVAKEYGDEIELHSLKKRIKRMNEKHKIFQIDDGTTTGDLGHPPDEIQLHDDTITYPRTAFVMDYIASQRRNYQLPIESTLKKTIEVAKDRIGLSEFEVINRVDGLKRVGYLGEKDGDFQPSYVLTKRYNFEKDYIKKLALIALDAPSGSPESKSSSNIE